MDLRISLGAVLALLMVAAPAGATASSDFSETGPETGPRLAFGLPGVFGHSSAPEATDRQDLPRLAQAGDPRVNQLQEEIRRLNGTIEDLNFQMLQMQEQMRKMQEDNEFRFQQLEGSGPASDNSRAERSQAAPRPAEGRTARNGGQNTVEGVIADDGGSRGAPPRQLGEIKVDKGGNVTSSQPAAEPGTGARDGTSVAALPPADSADELYRNAYQFILSGDYGTAEQEFRDHIARFPNDAKAADANYWLGEALLGQQKYRDAAEVFLNASKKYPKAGKAPDMMLKLGVSLSALKQRDVACATYAEVLKRYPSASDAFKKRVKEEQSSSSC